MWMFCLPKGTPIKVAYEPACLTCHSMKRIFAQYELLSKTPSSTGAPVLLDLFVLPVQVL